MLGLAILIYTFFLCKMIYDDELLAGFLILWMVLSFIFLFIFSITMGTRNRIKALQINLNLTISNEKVIVSDTAHSDISKTEYSWSTFIRIEMVDLSSPLEKVFRKHFRIIRFIIKDYRYDYLRNTYMPQAIAKHYSQEYAGCFFQMEYNQEAVEVIKKYWGEIIVSENRW